MKKYGIYTFLTASAVILGSCEKNRSPDPSPTNPNPAHLQEATGPEGGSGSIRNDLPASGAAATGQGNTSSTTSAASGAVNTDPDKTYPTEKYEGGTAPVPQESRP
ncbi:MAG: hypothetical protein EOP09_19755 [Proteobacteria bacterium]|nr:MAG: hypothetical protein EOP09_19755 [Pseudomonadota bacterium]